MDLLGRMMEGSESEETNLKGGKGDAALSSPHLLARAKGTAKDPASALIIPETDASSGTSMLPTLGQVYYYNF